MESGALNESPVIDPFEHSTLQYVSPCFSLEVHEKFKISYLPNSP